MTPREREHVEALMRAQRVNDRRIVVALAPEVLVVLGLFWLDPRVWSTVAVGLGIYHVVATAWLYTRWQRVLRAHDFGRYPELRGDG